jgi:hypothetical protein
MALCRGFAEKTLGELGAAQAQSRFGGDPLMV